METQNTRGLFITLEGLEGSGKSTQGARLKDWFEGRGDSVVLVGEPGGTHYGRLARELFLSQHRSICPQAEVGLLLTAKAQLLQEVILPALAEGKVVICDRYTDTLFAYQGYAKGHDMGMIQTMLEAFQCDVTPDLTIFFDILPETSVKRSLARKAAGGEYTDLDAETVAFHNKVRWGMLARITGKTTAGEPRVSTIIPCDVIDIQEVTEITTDRIDEFLKAGRVFAHG